MLMLPDHGPALAPGLRPVSAIAHPFEARRIDYAVPEGLTIAEIIEAVQPDPVLREHGLVFLDDQPVDRAYWTRVRPKPEIIVSIRLLPSGGGAARIIAMVAVVVLAAVVTWGVGAMLAGAVAAGTISTTTATAIAGLAGAAVSIGGTLLVNMLLPPPVPQLSRDSGNEQPTYAITGAQPGAAMVEGALPARPLSADAALCRAALPRDYRRRGLLAGAVRIVARPGACRGDGDRRHPARQLPGRRDPVPPRLLVDARPRPVDLTTAWPSRGWRRPGTSTRPSSSPSTRTTSSRRA